jgi:hypothetical protein
VSSGLLLVVSLWATLAGGFGAWGRLLRACLSRKSSNPGRLRGGPGTRPPSWLHDPGSDRERSVERLPFGLSRAHMPRDCSRDFSTGATNYWTTCAWIAKPGACGSRLWDLTAIRALVAERTAPWRQRAAGCVKAQALDHLLSRLGITSHNRKHLLPFSSRRPYVSQRGPK